MIDSIKSLIGEKHSGHVAITANDLFYSNYGSAVYFRLHLSYVF